MSDENRDLGSFRDDLAAVMVDREEQARLDSLLDVETDRVTSEFPKIIAYGWWQSKGLGGGLLLVCASCYERGQRYVGEPATFTRAFDESIACVFCKVEIQS